jgi:hypothetical protein
MARCQPLALRQPRSRSAARIARSAASGTATSVGVSYSYKFLIYCCTILSAIHKLYRHCVPLLHQQSVEGMVCPCARAQVRPTGRPRWLFHEPDSRPSSAALSGSRQSHGRRVRAHLDECSLIAAWATEAPRGARRWPASRPSPRAAAVIRLFVTVLTAIWVASSRAFRQFRTKRRPKGRWKGGGSKSAGALGMGS